MTNIANASSTRQSKERLYPPQNIGVFVRLVAGAGFYAYGFFGMLQLRFAGQPHDHQRSGGGIEE